MVTEAVVGLLLHHRNNGRKVEDVLASVKNKTGEDFTLEEAQKALDFVDASDKRWHIAAYEFVHNVDLKVVKEAKKAKKVKKAKKAKKTSK